MLQISQSTSQAEVMGILAGPALAIDLKTPSGSAAMAAMMQYVLPEQKKMPALEEDKNAQAKIPPQQRAATTIDMSSGLPKSFGNKTGHNHYTNSMAKGPAGPPKMG